jgi:hypothetical protein
MFLLGGCGRSDFWRMARLQCIRGHSHCLIKSLESLTLRVFSVFDGRVSIPPSYRYNGVIAGGRDPNFSE